MADVTYYFNSYGTGELAYWVDDENIVDGNIETFGSENSDGQEEGLDDNTCDGTDLGTISTVELRLFAYGDGGDRIDIAACFGDIESPSTYHETTPVVDPGGWSSYIDITTDTGAPSPWTWSDVESLMSRIMYSNVAKSNYMYCSKVEIRVTYTPADGNVTVTPTTLSLTLTEYVPVLKEVTTPTTLSLTLTEYIPPIIIGTIVTPGTLSLTLTKYIPILKEVTTPSTLNLTVTGYIPTITIPGVGVSIIIVMHHRKMMEDG